MTTNQIPNDAHKPIGPGTDNTSGKLDNQEKYPEEAKGIGEVNTFGDAIKNAHASGDGTMGRNETGVPDMDDDDPEQKRY